MKPAARNLVVVLLTSLLFNAAESAEADDPRLVKSRELVRSFATSLQEELKSALAEGGPLHAIDVCKDRAPQIASGLSRQSGAKVGRTSLRYRNPANAPEPWQVEALRRFDQGVETNQPASMPEYFAKGPDGTARYMAAIAIGNVCLVCHGDIIPAALEQRIEADYPHDLAVGYDVGDIRGAFSVTWPALEIVPSQ